MWPSSQHEAGENTSKGFDLLLSIKGVKVLPVPRDEHHHQVAHDPSLMPFHAVRTHNTRTEFLSTLLGYEGFKQKTEEAHADALDPFSSAPTRGVSDKLQEEDPASSDDELVQTALSDFSSVLQSPAYNDFITPNNSFWYF